MIAMRCHCATVKLFNTRNHHTIGTALNLTSQLAKLTDHGIDAIGFLDSQLFRITDCCGPFGQRGSDTDHRKFINGTGYHIATDFNAFQLAVPNQDIGNRLAGLFPDIEHFHLPTHGDQDIDDSTTGGVDTDIADQQLCTRSNQTGDHKKGRGRDISRDNHLLSQKSWPAGQTYTTLKGPHLGTKTGQHAFAMIPRQVWFSHRRFAINRKTGQKNG